MARKGPHWLIPFTLSLLLLWPPENQAESLTLKLFDKPIKLPSSCEFAGRPAAIDGMIDFWCDPHTLWDGVSLYKRANSARNAPKTIIQPGSIQTADFGEFQHFRFVYARSQISETIFNYEICDKEVCLAVHARHETFIRDIISQVTKDYLANSQH